MAWDGIESMGWGICGRQRTRPQQEPRDTAMAWLGGVRGKRLGSERDSGDIYFGKIVELMSWKIQESSSSRDGDIITSRLSPKVRLGWLAPPAVRLALRNICMEGHSLCQERSLPTWRHPCLRVELRGLAAKVSWVIFCSGRLLGCLEIQNGHKQLGMERTTTSSLVPFQPFQPGRNKLRRPQALYYTK